MRLPDHLMQCAVFISRGTGDIQFRGTAFIAGTPGIEKRSFLHLVTAKHVANAVGSGPFFIGLNLKSGEKVLVDSGTNYKWWSHPTEESSVDAAVGIFATQFVDEYNLQHIPENSFVSDELIQNCNIGIGDEIGIVGLFTQFPGTTKFQPILRSGNLAMMPTDKVPVSGFDPMEVYLAEGRSIGGLSGSPVFVQETLNMTVGDGVGGTKRFHGKGGLHFLGLVHGHWDLPINLDEIQRFEAVNMGVSIIVPAKKIREVLYHPELVALRQEFLSREPSLQGSP